MPLPQQSIPDVYGGIERRPESHRPMVLRTIRDGRVRIYDRTYAPRIYEDGVPYDGRLDGERWAFGLYPDPAYVCLWGSEARYHDPDPEHDWPGKACIDGFFVWEWWEAVDA